MLKYYSVFKYEQCLFQYSIGLTGLYVGLSNKPIFLIWGWNYIFGKKIYNQVSTGFSHVHTIYKDFYKPAYRFLHSGSLSRQCRSYNCFIFQTLELPHECSEENSDSQKKPKPSIKAFWRPLLIQFIIDIIRQSKDFYNFSNCARTLMKHYLYCQWNFFW